MHRVLGVCQGGGDAGGQGAQVGGQITCGFDSGAHYLPIDMDATDDNFDGDLHDLPALVRLIFVSLAFMHKVTNRGVGPSA